MKLAKVSKRQADVMVIKIQERKKKFFFFPCVRRIYEKKKKTKKERKKNDGISKDDRKIEIEIK